MQQSGRFDAENSWALLSRRAGAVEARQNRIELLGSIQVGAKHKLNSKCVLSAAAIKHTFCTANIRLVPPVPCRKREIALLRNWQHF